MGKQGQSLWYILGTSETAPTCDTSTTSLKHMDVHSATPKAYVGLNNWSPLLWIRRLIYLYSIFVFIFLASTEWNMEYCPTPLEEINLIHSGSGRPA